MNGESAAGLIWSSSADINMEGAHPPQAETEDILLCFAHEFIQK
jgi:hypothetical protein